VSAADGEAFAGDDLPGLTAFGAALVERVRHDDLADLPGLRAFGDALAARAPRRRRRRLRAFALAAAFALPIAATSGAATALVLQTAAVDAPVPAQVPDEQTPLAGTAHVGALRAPDPGGGYPWALRVARGKTGLTCTTVGQVHAGVFGLVGLDGVFRRLPGELSDACGQGALVGARVVAGATPASARTIVYGVAGDRLRAATLTTTAGRRALRLGAGGTFVAALRGYPEGSAAGVTLAFAGGRVERHNFGAAAGTVPDPAGDQAWRVDRLVLGTRQRCARVLSARPSATGIGFSGPTACLAIRGGTRAWAADARTLRPGEHGVAGFDGWNWRRAPARTVVWGVGRGDRTLTSVTLVGAGAPKRLALSHTGAFAAVLPASVAPAGLRLEVHLAGGAVESGRPGVGLVPDLVPSRRAR
jgi:hypothetical protein